MFIVEKNSSIFHAAAFLALPGRGRRIVELKPKQAFFTQGDRADSIFYLRTGRARLSVVSQSGKEATITLLSAGDFVGEESLATVRGPRLATATAQIPCVALEINREEMIREIHCVPASAGIFLKFMLARGMRIQADLVDHLFNSSEKRLARILLLMADFDKAGTREALIPPVTQQTLAEMIGTTRSRVSFFMNRFRKLGFITYNSRIQVHESLLNVLLHDQLPKHNSAQPRTESLKKHIPKSARTTGVLTSIDAKTRRQPYDTYLRRFEPRNQTNDDGAPTMADGGG